MIGKLLSGAIKVVTLPIDAVSAAADIATGGDGSKRSRTSDGDVFPNITGAQEQLRDRIAEAAEDIDD